MRDTPQKIKVKVYKTKPPRIDIKAHPNLNEVELGYVEGFFGGGGKIASISVNGVPQPIDEDKNVNLFIPTQLSQLENDEEFITDSYFTAGNGIEIKDVFQEDEHLFSARNHDYGWSMPITIPLDSELVIGQEYYLKVENGYVDNSGQWKVMSTLNEYFIWEGNPINFELQEGFRSYNGTISSNEISYNTTREPLSGYEINFYNGATLHVIETNITIIDCGTSTTII